MIYVVILCASIYLSLHLLFIFFLTSFQYVLIHMTIDVILTQVQAIQRKLDEYHTVLYYSDKALYLQIACLLKRGCVQHVGYYTAIIPLAESYAEMGSRLLKFC